MSGDYSRERFDPRNDFCGILQQQGKVQLDANANELARIQDRRSRAQTADTIGRCAVPRETAEGFKIAIAGQMLTIGPGRMYVDGLLAENHGAAPIGFDPVLGEPHGLAAVPYPEQPYLPDALKTAPPPLEGGPHLVYLVVFERELSYIERPALVEVAIGQDTVTALQVAWQVRVLPNVGAGVTCSTPDDQIPGWNALVRPSDGRLSTKAVDVVASKDPCVLGTRGGYRGLENQLYRLEIHDGGPVGKATFKWSRDNGTVATSVLSTKGTRLSVASTGRDAVLRFQPGDWVEITDDRRELTAQPGVMRRVADVVDEARVIELDAALPAAEFPPGDFDPDLHVRVRRWDQRGKVVDGAGKTIVQLDSAASTGLIPVPAAGTQVLLENGVLASFDLAAPDGEFKVGDYWTFAARIADASVEQLENAPPRGIHRHYCKLAVVTFPATVNDCRVLWPPEAGDGHDCGCTVCVTPEAHANGRPSLQAAVQQVIKAGGGTICLDVGTYIVRDPLRIDGARSLRIVGKGWSTQIVADREAIQVMNGSADIVLRDFAVSTRSGADLGSVVSILSSSEVRVEGVRIFADKATWSGIGLGGALQSILLRDNVVAAGDGIRSVNDPFNPNAAGLSDVRIEGNAFNCGNTGVRLDGVSIHQLMSQITGNRIAGCGQAGIVLTGVTVPGFALVVSENELVVRGDGIVGGVDGLRIDGNHILLAGEAPPDRALSGIVLTRTAIGDRLGDAQITSNRITGFSNGISGAVTLDTLTIAHNRVLRAEVGVTIRAERLGALLITGNQIGDVAGIGIMVESSEGRISALGNAVERVRRGPGIVLVSGAADCIVGNNEVLQVGGVDAPGLLVKARTVSAASNRVGGERVRIELGAAIGKPGPLATALGNIAGGDILLNGVPLGPPWDALNFRFVS